jgi:hypothetical protein
VSWSIVRVGVSEHAVEVALMALLGTFFRPNVLFLHVSGTGPRRARLPGVMRDAVDAGVGVALYVPYEPAGLGARRTVYLWMHHGRTDWTVDDAFACGNLNLILLLGYRFHRVWNARVVLHTVVDHAEDVAPARRFLDELCDVARFGASVEREVLLGEFRTVVREQPPADLSIFGLQHDAPDVVWAEGMAEEVGGSCLFVLDSGRESARA